MGVVTGGGGGGGGSAPAYQSGSYAGSAVTILNNGNTFLPFDNFQAGDDVINITNPLLPLVRKAGLFVVSAEVLPAGALSPGGSFTLELTLDLTGPAVAIRSAAGADAGLCEISNSWVMAVGDSFRLECANFDGVQSRDFHINNATVCRVGPA